MLEHYEELDLDIAGEALAPSVICANCRSTDISMFEVWERRYHYHQCEGIVLPQYSGQDFRSQNDPYVHCKCESCGHRWKYAGSAI